MKKNLLKAGVKFLAVAVLLICGGGGVLLGCKNAADGGVGGGGGGGGSGGGRDAGGGTPPLVAPSTADMVKDMENVIPSLKGTPEETKVKDFLDALSSTPAAKDAFDKWAKTDPNNPNSGYDQSKAEAIKALADKYDTEKNTSGTPTIVDTIKDLAKNNDGSDAKNTTSDLSKILDQTTNGGGTPIKDTITNALNTADTERQAVLKALSGTSPNAATSAGEAKSTALNTLGVTSADLYPLVSGLSGDANKNKLASLDNDLIKSLVKDKASKTPTGSNALEDYLNGGGDIADLTTYKDAIKANYPESNGQTLAQFIQNQKDLKNIYNKLGGGNEAAGKVAYDALINGGVTADKIKVLVTAVEPNAGKIKDIDTALVKNLVEKTSTNPTGTNALKAYLGAGGTTADLNTYKDKIEKLYPMKAGQTLADFIADMKSGAADATGGSSRVIQGTAETGDAIDENGKLVKKTEIKDNTGKIIGYIYKVDPATKTAYAVGTPSPTTTSSGTEKGDKKWAASGQKSLSNVWPHLYSSKEANKADYEGAATSGYEGWQLVRKDNPTALYQNFPAIKYSLCYPDPMTLTDAQIDAKFTGGSVKDRWYLPSVDELKDIYASLQRGELPSEIANKVSGKQLWSVNTSKANYSYIVDFNDGNDYEKNRLEDYWLVPIAQFTYQ